MAPKRTSPKSPNSPKPNRVTFKTGALLVGVGFLLGAAALFALRPRDNISMLVAERLQERQARRASRTVPAPVHSTAASPRLAAAPPPPASAPRARMAIVLDDWGYNLDAFEHLKDVHAPLTLAILPNLPYSAQIAEGAYREGHEIILHMPMEPKGAVPLEKSTILAKMTDAEIRDRLLRAIDGVPHLVGVSNHQGSKATADARVMKAGLETLKTRSLFFLDSLTTGDSAAGAEAKGLGMTVLRRDVFLDNERTEPAILARLDELARLAKSQGSAIGIGHDEPVTVEVIRKNLDRYASEGIDIVPLSDLYRKKS